MGLEAERDEQEAEHRPRMLLVDDEQDNTEFLRRLFRHDFAIEVADSGKEALERLARGRFDVIISDQMMPGMTGVELLNRSIELVPDAIRILITGFPNMESAISSINEARAFRFFTKPLDRNELRAAVSSALHGKTTTRGLKARVREVEAENERLRARVAEIESRGSLEDASESGGALGEIARLRSAFPLDEETGLLTREALVERLEQEVARSERYGLLCALCLVRVREYRELRTRGDVEAGRLLERITWLLRLGSRRYDLAARWNEDTFGMLLPHVGKRGAEARVERMRQAARTDAEETGGVIALEAAFASFPEGEESVEAIIAAAERSLGLA